MLFQIMTNSLLAIFIFFATNAIGGISLKIGYTEINYRYKREDNFAFDFVFKIITPILITIAFALIVHFLGYPIYYQNIWAAILGSWLIRIIYIITWNRHSLVNWWIFLLQASVSSSLSYWLYYKLIDHPTLLFPSRDNMISEVWLIVILFLYKAVTDINPRDRDSQVRKNQYLESKFKYLKARYGELISDKAHCVEVEILTYSIIIHENYNRPKIVRIFENFANLFKHDGTYGIMQVKSNKTLSDFESIVQGLEILNKLFTKVKTSTEEKNLDYKYPKHLMDCIVKRTAWHYNNSDDYADEIALTYELLSKKYYHPPKPVNPEDRFNALFHSSSM